jgi:hypothetical protein
MTSKKKFQFPILPSNLETFALQTIAVSFLLKIMYAYSRPIFNSGPDANGYIPMAIDIAHLGFFSSDISGLPVYPIGYGAFLSVFVFMSESRWIHLAQFAQITLISVSSYLFFSLVKVYFNKVVACLSLVIFLFTPSIFTMTTQAMYEPLLISIVICVYYFSFISLPKNNFSGYLRYLSVGILIGLAVVTHPRSIFILAIPLLFLTKNVVKPKKFLFLFSGSFIVIGTVLFRNFEALGFLTLSTATKYAVAYGHKSVGLCESTFCYLSNALDNPSTFMLESFRNFIYFFSPSSGPLTRGTWFHNLSVSSFLDKNGFQSFALIISGLVMFALFTVFVFGSWQSYYLNKSIPFLFIGIILLTALTDAAVYGDSRHRLVVMPFIIPIQVYGLFYLLSKALSDQLRNVLGTTEK